MRKFSRQKKRNIMTTITEHIDDLKTETLNFIVHIKIYSTVHIALVTRPEVLLAVGVATP